MSDINQNQTNINQNQTNNEDDREKFKITKKFVEHIIESNQGRKENDPINEFIINKALDLYDSAEDIKNEAEDILDYVSKKSSNIIVNQIENQTYQKFKDVFFSVFDKAPKISICSSALLPLIIFRQSNIFRPFVLCGVGFISSFEYFYPGKLYSSVVKTYRYKKQKEQQQKQEQQTSKS